MSTKIIHSFNQASESYDAVASVQRKSAEILVQKLLLHARDFEPQTILDLGTGTGYVPEILLQHYPRALYTLNDIAPKMIEASQLKFRRYDNFKFSIADMESVNMTDQELIISNFAMQWAKDIDATIARSYQYSQVFAFTCLLHGTFNEWYDLLSEHGIEISKFSYHSEETLIDFCSNLDCSTLHFESLDFKLQFQNAYEFTQYLKSLGAAINDSVSSLSALHSLLINHKSALDVTYKVFFAILKR